MEEIFEAVKWAPSWGNSQCWELIVIRDRSQKEKLATTLAKKNPATLAVMNAPIILVLCAELKKSGFYKEKQITKYHDWFMYDLGIVTQNICLTAYNLGLGSVIVGAFEHDKAKQLFDIPKGYEIVSIIPIGYPAHNPPDPKRRETKEFVHEEYFGKRITY